MYSERFNSGCSARSSATESFDLGLTDNRRITVMAASVVSDEKCLKDSSDEARLYVGGGVLMVLETNHGDVLM